MLGRGGVVAIRTERMQLATRDAGTQNLSQVHDRVIRFPAQRRCELTWTSCSGRDSVLPRTGSEINADGLIRYCLDLACLPSAAIRCGRWRRSSDRVSTCWTSPGWHHIISLPKQEFIDAAAVNRPVVTRRLPS